MTQNKARKLAARQRAAVTGESYTAARRKATAEAAEPAPVAAMGVDEVSAALGEVAAGWLAAGLTVTRDATDAARLLVSREHEVLGWTEPADRRAVRWVGLTIYYAGLGTRGPADGGHGVPYPAGFIHPDPVRARVDERSRWAELARLTQEREAKIEEAGGLPVEVWVDAGEVLESFGIDGFDEYSTLDDHVRDLYEELGNDHERTRAAMDDRWAMDSLIRQDEDTYQDALMDAVEQIATERGVDVVVRRANFSETNPSGTLAAELYAAAIGRAVLPQLGHAPEKSESGVLVTAVKAAGRTYRERIGTDERPDVAAERAEMEAELTAAELAPGEPVVPLDSLAVGDVVTVQPLEEDGSIDMEPITGTVGRADEHSVVIGVLGKMVRHNGRLMLDSTGDMFDVVAVDRAQGNPVSDERCPEPGCKAEAYTDELGETWSHTKVRTMGGECFWECDSDTTEQMTLDELLARDARFASMGPDEG
jgi:hypothetical protein